MSTTCPVQEENTMSDTTFDALRDAVTLARQYQIQTVVRLRGMLKDRGHQEEAIQEALRVWGNRIRQTGF